ncbi:MAG: hypothetical protein ABII26_08905 [Pseudomonadota bacterium]
MIKEPEFVIPAPQQVRDKLQRESRIWNSATELLDARLRGHDVVMSFYSHRQRFVFELFWTVMFSSINSRFFEMTQTRGLLAGPYEGEILLKGLSDCIILIKKGAGIHPAF